MSQRDFVVLLIILILLSLPIFWHGDVKRPLTAWEMVLAHSRWGHPKSPHKVWAVETGEWRL